MNLFMDDSYRRQNSAREILEDITICQTARACIELLDLNTYETVYLDHDLGLETWVDSDRVDSGMEVVRWLEDNPIQRKHPKYVVHSWNGPAGKEMADRLNAAGYNAEYAPFSG
jgi:hypothetical protein